MAADHPNHSRRLLVIFNPTAGSRRRRRLEETLRILREAGCRLELRQTLAAGDAARLARDFDPETFDAVVAAGGDGTINEVINGLVAGRSAAAPPCLAIVPLGTANVLAAEIGLRIDPPSIAAAILAGRTVTLSLGTANGRLFALMVGVGFDAHVVRHVDLALKRRIGKAAYLWETLRQLACFPFPTYRVTVDGAIHEAASIIVAKGRHYAGRFVCAPRASLEDPLLHVCLFTRRGAWNLLRYGAGLLFGWLPHYPDFRIVTGRVVTIEEPAGDPVQGDGDAITELPLKVTLLPAALRLCVPASED